MFLTLRADPAAEDLSCSDACLSDFLPQFQWSRLLQIPVQALLGKATSYLRKSIISTRQQLKNKVGRTQQLPSWTRCCTAKPGEHFTPTATQVRPLNVMSGRKQTCHQAGGSSRCPELHNPKGTCTCTRRHPGMDIPEHVTPRQTAQSITVNVMSFITVIWFVSSGWAVVHRKKLSIYR